MSKTVLATCENGVVKIGGKAISEPLILSEGVGSSEGVAVLDQEACVYIPKITPDLKTTLQKIALALTQIASALTTLDAKPIGTLPSAPGAAPAIAQISSIKAELETLSGGLK